MRTIDDLVKGGDPVDPDLVSFLAAEGLDTIEEVQALGRPHFVQIFADRAGFTRDFVTLLEDLELTWETAATAERLQCPPDEMEIGVGSSVVIAKLGADMFADVFRHPREVVQTAMAERDGMLLELDELLVRHNLKW